MRGARWRCRRAITALLLPAAALAGLALGERSTSPAHAGSQQWTTLRSSPLARTEVGAARIGDRIYVVGGFIPQGGSTGKLVRYDISDNRWKRLTSAPIEVNHPGVAALEGRLYLFGGDTPTGRSARLFRYSPQSDRWKRLADAPTARAALALVAFDTRLYAIGGVDPAGDTGRVEIYNPSSDRWRGGSEMPTPRNHIAGAALGDRIYVTGGRTVQDGSVVNLDVVESYNPARDAWRSEPSLTVPRSGHATVATAARLYAFGGEEVGGGNTIGELESLRPAGAWSTAGLSPMLTPRHGLGAATLRGRIFAVEGGPQPGLAFSDALEVLPVR